MSDEHDPACQLAYEIHRLVKNFAPGRSTTHKEKVDCQGFQKQTLVLPVEGDTEFYITLDGLAHYVHLFWPFKRLSIVSHATLHMLGVRRLQVLKETIERMKKTQDAVYDRVFSPHAQHEQLITSSD